ncbi:MAG TPA: hypothetical protein VJO99_16190 [Burkholderiaceae bacterium]|nr:hypothetical protein [Burkholderiaceae bacterium]
MPTRLSALVVVAALLVSLLVLAGLALFMAYYKGRDSRSYRAVSAIVAPISQRLHHDTTSDIRPPYASPRGQLEPEWQWLQRDGITIEPRTDSLEIAATRESLWFLNARGPLVYRQLVGDGTISAVVRARKRTDPTIPPDMEWQFAGLLMRDPASDAWMSLENYVFNVIGFCCGELQLETKSTREGGSEIHSFRWDSGDAELAIQRSGARFTLRARRAGSGDAWRELVSYERPDLPARLQVGLILYAHSQGRGRHDLRAFFEQIAVR